jgi:hypothetical protein
LAELLDNIRVTERCRHWAGALRRSDPLGETCTLLEELIPR